MLHLTSVALIRKPKNVTFSTLRKTARGFYEMGYIHILCYNATYSYQITLL